MKKILAFLLVFVLAFTFVACNGDSGKDNETTGADETEDVKSEGVMTYEEYVAAAVDAQVVIETYIQAKQGWWEKDGVGGVATFYTQDRDGAYFIYDMPCSQEDYTRLVPGTKIKVTGYKAVFNGEIEIGEGATYEIIEGKTYIAPAFDITSKLADANLADYMNRFVSFKGMTVEAITDKDGNEHNFMYNWDGSGSEGNDLYFKVGVNGASYTFTVESYLTGADTDVYKAVKSLKVGDVVDMEGFLYWYEGVNPHITSVTVVTPAAE